jgi:hypothetical protein
MDISGVKFSDLSILKRKIKSDAIIFFKAIFTKLCKKSLKNDTWPMYGELSNINCASAHSYTEELFDLVLLGTLLSLLIQKLDVSCYVPTSVSTCCTTQISEYKTHFLLFSRFICPMVELPLKCPLELPPN